MGAEIKKQIKEVILAVAMIAVVTPMTAQAWVREDDESHAEYFRKDKIITERWLRGEFQRPANTYEPSYQGDESGAYYPQARPSRKARTRVAPAPNLDGYEEEFVAPQTRPGKVPPKSVRLPEMDRTISPSKIGPKSVKAAGKKAAHRKGAATLQEISAPIEAETVAPAPAAAVPAPAQSQTAKQECEPTTTGSGADKTLSDIRKNIETLRKVDSKPAANPPAPERRVAQTKVKFLDEETGQYVEAERQGSRKPLDLTPLDESHRQSPKSDFIKRLLKSAEAEANVRCRRTSRGMNCKPGAKGMCLQGVRMAFQKAKGESTASGWTLNAKDAGPHLRKYGYRKIELSQSNTAPPGAVFIYRNTANPAHAGHIAIKGENGWYADYYDKYQINDPRARVYLPTRKLVEVWVPSK